MMAYPLPRTPFEFTIVNTFVHVDEGIDSPRAVPLFRHATCPPLVLPESATQIVTDPLQSETRHCVSSMQPQCASEIAPDAAQRNAHRVNRPSVCIEASAVNDPLHIEEIGVPSPAREEAGRRHAVSPPSPSMSKRSCSAEREGGDLPDDNVSTDDDCEAESVDVSPSDICDIKLRERSDICEDILPAGPCEHSSNRECIAPVGSNAHRSASEVESPDARGIEEETMKWTDVVRRGARAKWAAKMVTPSSPMASSPRSTTSAVAMRSHPTMSHMKKAPEANAKRSIGAPLRHPQQRVQELSKTIPVGLEDDDSFHVMKRLLGPCGQRLRSIATQAGEGVRISIKGRGSSVASAASPADTGPLTVWVMAKGSGAAEKLSKASSLVEALLKDVHREYDAVVSRRQQQAERQKAWDGSAAGNRQGRQQFFRCRYLVGIEDDRDFRVVYRLLGPGAENQKYIVQEAQHSSGGCIVSLSITGKGAGRDGSGSGPLAIMVSASSQAGIQKATDLVEELLADIHEQRRIFCRERKLAEPALAVKREDLA